MEEVFAEKLSGCRRNTQKQKGPGLHRSLDM
jgi:hypothetical protein